MSEFVAGKLVLADGTTFEGLLGGGLARSEADGGESGDTTTVFDRSRPR